MLGTKVVVGRAGLKLASNGRLNRSNRHGSKRLASRSSAMRFYSDDRLNAPRDSDQADVVIVGGGPSGLATAIRIKQMCKASGKDLRVCLLEKGAEVGAFRNYFFFFLSTSVGRSCGFFLPCSSYFLLANEYSKRKVYQFYSFLLGFLENTLFQARIIYFVVFLSITDAFQCHRPFIRFKIQYPLFQSYFSLKIRNLTRKRLFALLL
jgi:hypothetical protein